MPSITFLQEEGMRLARAARECEAILVPLKPIQMALSAASKRKSLLPAAVAQQKGCAGEHAVGFLMPYML